MKKTLTLISGILFSISLSAQTPGWTWANDASGTAEVEPRAATTDASDNVYVAGRYAQGYAIFGVDTLFNSGNSDIFLAKYDAAGTVQWTVHAGGNQNDRANAVITDAIGNIYLTGYFGSSSIIFGTDTLQNPGSPFANVFLVKFNSAGGVIWARSEGDVDWEEADVITIDAAGDVYVAGTFTGFTSVFGTDTLVNQSPGNGDIWLAKYDLNGNVIWAKSAGGNQQDVPESITASVSGNIYVAGNFHSTVLNIGSYSLNNVQPGDEELFLAKYDANGNVQWARSAAGDGIDQGSYITTDVTGNIYMCAFYDGDSITFGSVTLYNTSIAPSIYHDDIVLVKYDANGNVIWVKTASGNDNEQTSTIAADLSGNIYVAGLFEGDSMKIDTTVLYPLGGNDIFIIKYDTSGAVQWAIQAGGTSADLAPHFASRGNLLGGTGAKMLSSVPGSMYVSGYFSSASINFGPDVVTSSGNPNMFVAKLGSGTTAIKLTENSFLTNVYPNPSSGKFIIQSRQKISSVEIKNLFGEKIYSSSINSEKTEIDLSSYLKGIYFVEIISDEKKLMRKIILE